MKNKAFTLVELLAVIVVLAVILAIAVPRVISVVENSRKEAFRISVENLARIGKQLAKISETSKTYTITNGAFVGDSIPVSGTLPNDATILVKSDGAVSLVAFSDKYCVEKRYDEETVMVKDGIECVLPVSKIYGVIFNNTSTGTRTDDAVGLTYKVNASTIDSSFDTAEIYKDITEETDIYGNVFVKIPRFYIKKTKSAGNIWTYQISKEMPDSSYYLPECFKNSTTGELLDFVLIGKYQASLNENKLESKSGTTPLVSQTLDAFRTYARANGAGYQLIDIHAVDVLQVLFYVEFAKINSQSVMYGYTSNSASIANGTTDSVTSKSGSPVSNATGYNAMKYRGVENLYGNVSQYVDGVNMQNFQVYVAKNSNNYASDIFNEEYTSIGYINYSSSNFLFELGYDSSQPYANFPILAGLFANSIYGDRYSVYNGNRVAHLGGNWSSGNASGLTTWSFSNSSGDAYSSVGSRLMKKVY